MLTDIIIAFTSIIVTFLITHLYHLRQSKDFKELSKGVKLHDVKHGVTNEGFYKTFKSHISNARSQIYITGRGLKMDSKEEIEIAESYLSAFSQALKKAEITRIQYGKEASLKWYEAFREIWRESKGNLHFYILEDSNDLLHSAAIDPNDELHCVGEIMMPIQVPTMNSKPKEIAGSAIFIEGKIEIAQSIANRIASIKDQGLEKGNCKKIDSEESWKEIITQHDNV